MTGQYNGKANAERLFSLMADAALEAFNWTIPTGTDVGPSSELAKWVRANVIYRPETEFFVVFILECDMCRRIAERRKESGDHE